MLDGCDYHAVVKCLGLGDRKLWVLEDEMLKTLR